MNPYPRTINKRSLSSDSVLAARSCPRVQIATRIPIEEAPWPGPIADQMKVQAHTESKCIINLSNCMVASQLSIHFISFTIFHLSLFPFTPPFCRVGLWIIVLVWVKIVSPRCIWNALSASIREDICQVNPCSGCAMVLGLQCNVNEMLS